MIINPIPDSWTELLITSMGNISTQIKPRILNIRSFLAQESKIKLFVNSHPSEQSGDRDFPRSEIFHLAELILCILQKSVK